MNKTVVLKSLAVIFVEPSTLNSKSVTTYALVGDSGGEGAVTGACAGDKSALCNLRPCSECLSKSSLRKTVCVSRSLCLSERSSAGEGLSELL